MHNTALSNESLYVFMHVSRSNRRATGEESFMVRLSTRRTTRDNTPRGVLSMGLDNKRCGKTNEHCTPETTRPRMGSKSGRYDINVHKTKEDDEPRGQANVRVQSGIMARDVSGNGRGFVGRAQTQTGVRGREDESR